MDAILFSDTEKTAHCLIQACLTAGIDGSLEMFRATELLYHRIRRPACSRAVAVIAMREQKTMNAVLEEKELIKNIKTLLILPDDNMETIVKAHLLQPRFVIFQEDILLKLPAILTKIQQNFSHAPNHFDQKTGASPCSL